MWRPKNEDTVLVTNALLNDEETIFSIATLPFDITGPKKGGNGVSGAGYVLLHYLKG